MNPHVFAGNPLDRSDVQRRDQHWLDAQARDPRSLYLPLWQLNVLIHSESDTRLRSLSRAAIEALGNDRPHVFLGRMDGVAHVAIDISQLGGPQHELNLDQTWLFEEARSAATQRNCADTGILAQSRAQV